MSIGVVTTIRLSRMLSNDSFKPFLNRTVLESSNVVIEKYKRQAPVDTGNLRNSVVVKMNYSSTKYEVTTLAQSRGVRYPVHVHEGTGVFKGVSQDWPSRGRVRRGETRRGLGGIRPNKFATRARDDAEKPVVKFIDREIGRYVKENRNVVDKVVTYK